jgi:hypothetical protein
MQSLVSLVTGTTTSDKFEPKSAGTGLNLDIGINGNFILDARTFKFGAYTNTND